MNAENYLLTSQAAKTLYRSASNLPIVDYHCHLSPKQIFEDEPFSNIGCLWLSDDHYKWRLMRCVGIDEAYITGAASDREKFIHYAEALSLSPGNPLYHWSHMELSRYFGIEAYLNAHNAEEVWEAANAAILSQALSPRKMILQSRVEILCTTDDIIDSLTYHKALATDRSFPCRVLPSFRTDNLLLMRRPNYLSYLKTLAEVSGVAIDSLKTLKLAVKERLQAFLDCGCRFSDMGIPYFPHTIADEGEADKAFSSLLAGNHLTDKAYDGLLGHFLVWLGAEYAKNGLVMQWHLAVSRNANTKLYQTVGADAGGDCIADPIDGENVIGILDAIEREYCLPKTVLYSLNPSFTRQLATIAGSFRNVQCGAAWWFCDTKAGILEQLTTIAELGSLGTFLGMLTDSRSFLSYARHDYFRRLLCSLIGEWIEGGEYDRESAEDLIRRVSYQNIKDVFQK